MNPDNLFATIAADDTKFQSYLADFLTRMNLTVQNIGFYGVACDDATVAMDDFANAMADIDAALPYEEPEPVKRRAIALRGIPLGAD